MPMAPYFQTTSATMRAVVGQALGSLAGYRLQTLALPEPGPAQVRVRITVAALGHADGLLAEGRYQVRPAVPFVPGCEFAGVIDAVGSEVAGWRPGQRVAGHNLGGALAEYAVVHPDNLRLTPEALSDEESAAFWVDHATAFHALRDRAALRPGETVLVLGAAGSLGLAAIQVARALGAQVIAAASSPAKRDAAMAAGAWQSLDYTAPGWGETLKHITQGRGVNVVFDPVGGATFETAFRRLAWGGRHLVLGFTAGAIPSLPINLALIKGASLVGVEIRQFATLHEPAKARQERHELAAMVESGLLRPVIGRRLRLEDYASALASSFDRQRIGKTVVQIQ
jgi:NADPH2:quinone reductase